MAKPLTERIAERMKGRSISPRQKNRAAFLALRPEIDKALVDGWPIRAVWETLHSEGKIQFSYDAFVNYVRKLITSPAGQRVSHARPDSAAPSAAGESAAPSPAAGPRVGKVDVKKFKVHRRTDEDTF